jgi:DNA-binding IclR family transcriptional regulator
MPAEQVKAMLQGPLVGFTGRTIIDPKRLESELARIRRQGWAQDKGEYAPSICAFAAPIFDRSGKTLAALSVPFLAGVDATRRERIRVSVIAAAAAIGSDLPEHDGSRHEGS